MFPKEDPLQIWQHAHGASSHFPIALLIMSFLFDLVSAPPAPAVASLGPDSRTSARPQLSLASYTLLVIAALGTIPSALSGFAGYFGWFGWTKWQASSLDTHRNTALIAAGTMLLLAIWRTVRRNDLRGGERIAYLVVTLLAVLSVGFTGWIGGIVARGY